MLDKLFPVNQHSAERALRVALGIAILSLTVIGPQSPWAFLGLIPLLTGLMGSCPLYTMLGFTTCATKRRVA